MLNLEKTIDAPPFIPEEADYFDGVFADAIRSERTLFLVRCRGLVARPDCVETFAASYLLMNALLMDRLNTKILKLVYLEDEADSSIFPTLNALRAFFHSDYSSLSMIGAWKQCVDRQHALSTPSTQRIESAIRFFEGSGIGEHNEDFNRATVFLSARTPAGVVAPYTVTDTDPFRLKISSKNNTLDVFTPELFMVDPSMSARIDQGQTGICVDVDVEQEGWLNTWFSNVEQIVQAKMYAGPRA